MEKKIGHYEIVSELGRGGMGVVYKAHEQSLNRFVAIKMLGEHLEEDSAYVQRFVREAQSAAKLNHPNIVQIYAINESEGRHYFVMEYVSGTSLHRIIRSEGSLPATRAARIVLQTAAGLAAAHEVEIIHRDIKPANIMITEKGLVKIADFGLALATGGASRLTATGMFMGTPGYLSPEQCLDKTVDARTDIYSLGITLFEMLTGSIPFKADSPLALLRQIIEVEPPDVRELNPEVDAASRDILVRMIAKNPDDRYQSCDQLIGDLQAYLDRAGVSTHDIAAVSAGKAPVPVAAAGKPAETDRAVTLNTSPTMAVASGDQPAAAVPPPPPPQAASESAHNAPTELMPEVVPEMVPEVAPEVVTPPPQAVPVKKSPVGLILAAVAAVVLLAMAAGATMAWRSGFLPRLLGRDSRQVATQSTGIELGNTGSGSGAIADTEEIAADPDAGDVTDSAAMAEALPDPSASSDAGRAAADSEDAPDSKLAGDAGDAAAQGSQPSGERHSSTASASSSASSSPRPPAKAAPGRAVVAEPQSRGAASVPGARADDADEAPAAPRPRGVVVVAVGERLLAGQAEAVVQRALARHGAKVVDEARFPEVLDLLTQSDPPVTALIELLRPHAARLVVVHAEYLGDRQLLHYGGRDVVFRSRLRIRPFDLLSGEAVGPGFDDTIEYNQLTVERNTEEALRRHMRQMMQQMNGS